MHLTVLDKCVTIVPLDDQRTSNISSWTIHFSIFNSIVTVSTLQPKPLLLTVTTDQIPELKYLKRSSARLYIYVFISYQSYLKQSSKTWHQPIVTAEIWNLHYKNNNVKDH